MKVGLMLVLLLDAGRRRVRVNGQGRWNAESGGSGKSDGQVGREQSGADVGKGSLEHGLSCR